MLLSADPTHHDGNIDWRKGIRANFHRRNSSKSRLDQQIALNSLSVKSAQAYRDKPLEKREHLMTSMSKLECANELKISSRLSLTGRD